MKWIYRLERKLGRNFGVPNLMIYITGTMLAVYMLTLIIMRGLPWLMFLDRTLVMQGQVWRLVTFLFVPPAFGAMGVLGLLILLYAAYIFGSALERAWGCALFTLYFIFGAVGAMIAGLISGAGTNHYLYLSLFLAYAYLYPNSSILLFFVLPVKAKYLAYVNWAVYIYAFIIGNFSSRLAIVFSLINFFLFFGPELSETLKRAYKQSKQRQQYRKNWGDHWR